MYVQVEHGLSGAGAHVQNSAVSVVNIALASDRGGGEVAAADEFGVVSFSLFQASEMFLRDDENVRGRFGVDVFEGKYMVVFIDFLRGNFAAEDAAEEAVRISHGWVT
jgi:hypothetical protein